jgi:hypothetical protein
MAINNQYKIAGRLFRTLHNCSRIVEKFLILGSFRQKRQPRPLPLSWAQLTYKTFERTRQSTVVASKWAVSVV